MATQPAASVTAFQRAAPPNALRAGRHQFGIVALDRGRHDKHVGAGDVLGLVADIDLMPLSAAG
jgi:hypothetical protein